MNSKDRNLQVIESKGIFKKIIDSIINIFRKGKQSYNVSNNDITNKSNNSDFLNSIRVDEDSDTFKLLKIQDELEKRGINRENAFELTKDLSEEQRMKLESLYKKQIRELELSIEVYKNKIMSIRKDLGA